MAITLNTPTTRQAATTVRLITFTINAEVRYAEARFNIGHMDAGQFVKTAGRTVTFQNSSDTADFTFDQLLNNITEIHDLKEAIETAMVAFNVFDGTVT